MLRPILSAICIVLVLTGWIIFAPSGIGGQTTYIILVGNSMEPDFKYGDLVLVRNASKFFVGDIVTYNQPDVGTILHRIVRIENGSYILKGDNNSWEDTYEPSEQEIIGKLWIHIPTVGKFFQLLRTPGVFSMMIVSFSALVLLTLFHDNSEKNHQHDQISDTCIQEDKVQKMDKKYSDSLYLVFVIGFIAAILAFTSFTQPLKSSSTDNIAYTHYGYFEYYADVPDDVFEGNVLQSGDPIFRQLNDSFEITFSYELKSDQFKSVQGTYRLLAKINESSGWNRTVEIIPYSLIVENSFTSSGTLDLSEIQTLVDNFEEQTGISNNRYTLDIIPEVILEGTIGGREFEDTFMPEMAFSFDDQKLILSDESTGSSDILNPVESGVVLGSQDTDNTISILGFDLSVLIIRLISIYGISTSLIAFILLSRRHKKLLAEKENNKKE